MVSGPIFIFKSIISVLSLYKKRLIGADFDSVNDLLSQMNKNDHRMNFKEVETVIKGAQSIDITLPDLTASSVGH